MKKVLLVFVLALVAFTAKAQLYVGGGVGFTAAGPSFAISPEVGYSFNDNMAAGAALNFGIGNGFFDFEVNPYFRMYFLDWGNVRFFADAHFNFSVISFNGGSTTTWGIGVRPGIAFPVNDRFSIVTHIMQLGYYNGGFDFSLNTGSTIGIYYNF